MRVLIIKTSSLGDIIHTLPALTEAGKNISDISFDWAVEPAFAEIPKFHPLVKNIILSPLRYFRKNFIKTFRNKELQKFCETLHREKYDYIIDAQGLIKSGLLTFIAQGIKCGYDRHSIWESLACLAYDKKFSVSPNLHAITRIRLLFSQALQYKINNINNLDNINYNILLNNTDNHTDLFNHTITLSNQYAVFLHGTTRDDKRWPEEYWIKLITLLKNNNIKILLPWGNAAEKESAERLALQYSYVSVLPKLNITDLARLLYNSSINIAVDTGLGHLSAALDKSTISLYGPTDPALIGTVGKNQIHIKSESNLMSDILPEQIYQEILTNLPK